MGHEALPANGQKVQGMWCWGRQNKCTLVDIGGDDGGSMQRSDILLGGVGMMNGIVTMGWERPGMGSEGGGCHL